MGPLASSCGSPLPPRCAHLWPAMTVKHAKKVAVLREMVRDVRILVVLAPAWDAGGAARQQGSLA